MVIQGNDQLVVSIPGATGADIRKLGAAAQLAMRPLVMPVAPLSTGDAHPGPEHRHEQRRQYRDDPEPGRNLGRHRRAVLVGRQPGRRAGPGPVAHAYSEDDCRHDARALRQYRDDGQAHPHPAGRFGLQGSDLRGGVRAVDAAAAG